MSLAGPLPPPSLELVISTFAMQAMIAMGAMANPMTNKNEVQLDRAKHFIDTVALLQEKTAGNRTPQEDAILDNVLHDLRAGQPVAPFMSIREAAMSWVEFASRAEGCHYLAAIWEKLPDDDRQRFLRRAV